jgi:hypothetical protein
MSFYAASTTGHPGPTEQTPDYDLLLAKSWSWAEPAVVFWQARSFMRLRTDLFAIGQRATSATSRGMPLPRGWLSVPVTLSGGNDVASVAAHA